MLLFAEHRYYGKTQPLGPDVPDRLRYLTMEQALADYAVFLDAFKATHAGAADSPVIAFGGSYGGMLAAWLRMKYPGSVAGAISASAPILAFQGATKQPWDSNAYWRVVTRDATPDAGSSAGCADNVRKTWPLI